MFSDKFVSKLFCSNYRFGKFRNCLIIGCVSGSIILYLKPDFEKKSPNKNDLKITVKPSLNTQPASIIEDTKAVVKISKPFLICAQAAEVSSDNIEKMKFDLQTMYAKEKVKLEKEVLELRRQVLLHRIQDEKKTSKLKKSLIELYSDVLDELEGFNLDYSKKDQLPRVVVVGEQSAGKTSVLEMVAGARLFPRGAGSMMTRAPVKVTLAEGPYRVARFDTNEGGLGDSGIEFDLESEAGCAALRKEIESRMDRLARGTTISRTPVSLCVRGPGLRRMVLVDLPGVINTVTAGMHAGAKDAVVQLASQYMSNPNAIILCIQDGSKDAESSSIVDLVSSMDPTGKRTIFVLTKVDLAVNQMSNPNRIQDILSGKVFKMKALGYFAVIAGKGNKDESIDDVRRYEADFFSGNPVFQKSGGLGLQPHQMSTDNLSAAVSERFWRMVEDAVEKQHSEFRALRFNLETEWKHKFKGIREQDRMELFEKARNEILDSLLVFNDIGTQKWEDNIKSKIWESVKYHVFEQIIIPANQFTGSSGGYQATVDILLKRWVDDDGLPENTVKVGHDMFMEQLLGPEDGQEDGSKVAASSGLNSCEMELFKPLHDAVFDQTFKQYSWDDKAQRALKVIQFEALNNATIKSKADWTCAVEFLIKSLESQLKKADKTISNLKGPGFWRSYLYWSSKSETQKLRAAVIEELENIFKGDSGHLEMLTSDELTSIRRNLQLKKVDVDAGFIQSTWHALYRQHFYRSELAAARDCTNSFYHYESCQTSQPEAETSRYRDVLLFWRLSRMLEASASALMMQISNNENRRLEKVLKGVLDDILIDDTLLSRLISGERVKLAEDLKHIRRVQEKLERFIQALKTKSTR